MNDCNSASVNQLLCLPNSDKRYTDPIQLNHRPPATTIYNNSNTYQNVISQSLGPTVAMFNDNSNPKPSHFAQLPQCLPPPVPENLGKNYIANKVVSTKQAIKLPSLSLPHFNGNLLRYHDWINNFFSMVHNNTGINDTSDHVSPNSCLEKQSKSLSRTPVTQHIMKQL